MNKSFSMAFRRRKRSKRIYFRKRGLRRVKKSTYRRKKLSSKRFKQWWPDLLYTKFKSRVQGIYDIGSPAIVMDKLYMSNPKSNYGPWNATANASQTNGQLFHLFFLNPNMYSTQPSALGTHSCLFPISGSSVPITADFPDMKTTALRYIAYRTMGVKITCTFRNTDNDNSTTLSSYPYFITGMPFQNSEPTLGNYWQGYSLTNTNGVSADLTFSDVANLPHGFVRKVKGHGAKGGGVKTVSFMMYPWKVYGLTRQQWLNDPKARMLINDPNTGKYYPYFSMALADYNPNYQRTYCMDYSITVYVRWEGQKFLQPEQA